MIGVIVILRLLTLRHEQQMKQPLQDKPSVVKTTDSSLDEEMALDSFQAIDEAKGSLEKVDKQVVSKQALSAVSESVKLGLDALKAVDDQSKVQLTYENRLSITNPARAQTLVTMFLAGYTYDAQTLEVYKSNETNVYQFVFSLKKAGAEDISFSGNYVKGTKQIEVVNMYGIPAGVVF